MIHSTNSRNDNVNCDERSDTAALNVVIEEIGSSVDEMPPFTEYKLADGVVWAVVLGTGHVVVVLHNELDSSRERKVSTRKRTLFQRLFR